METTTIDRTQLKLFECPLQEADDSTHSTDCPFGHRALSSTSSGSSKRSITKLRRLPLGICVDHLLGRCGLRQDRSGHQYWGGCSVDINGRGYMKCLTGYHPTSTDLVNLSAYRKSVAYAGGNIDKKPQPDVNLHLNFGRKGRCHHHHGCAHWRETIITSPVASATTTGGSEDEDVSAAVQPPTGWRRYCQLKWILWVAIAILGVLFTVWLYYRFGYFANYFVN